MNFTLNPHRIDVVSFLLLRILGLPLIRWCYLVKDGEPRGLMRIIEGNWGVWGS